MDFIESYWTINRNRYLNPRQPVPRAPDSLDVWLNQLDEKRFTQDFRVTRHQFIELVVLIQDHIVFFNEFNVSQTTVWCQLMATLYRFGCDGNGASIWKQARHFRCAEGTIELFTDRCITALITLEADVVSWPDVNEREEISARIEELSGLRQCIGYVDGTLFPFSTKAEHDGSDYYSRKGCYGMVGLVVCNDHKRIRYLYTGWAGCCHDARLMANCELQLCKNKMFHGNQYLFFSLKGLRLRLRNERGGGRIVAWIRACVVLHNLLLYVPRVGDSEVDNPNRWIPVAKELPDLVDDGNFDNALIRNSDTEGKRKRLRVMKILLDHMTST
ncbi:Hypothetical protein PHPALM_6127 [Phytophthora palmivora]|uniref:DDE Tnp4 domain-containing protein n=1 Tax=Phytophthora palmivora TaxID=4796 RepID=A0A2P4YFM0_9STRA|nr:Hypothetical protein PHPALM_6127 [Phytophthora palmivora]